MSFVGIVRKLRQPPRQVLLKNRVKDGILDIGMFEDHWRKANRLLNRTRKSTEDFYHAKKEAVAHAMEHTKEQAQQFVRVSKGAMRNDQS